jgi:hypothetical protein
VESVEPVAIPDDDEEPGGKKFDAALTAFDTK